MKLQVALCVTDIYEGCHDSTDIGCENGYVANNICSPKENDCNTCFNKSITSFSRSFIRLVDYLVTSTFHQMVVKAVAHMLSVLQQQRCQSPSQSRSPSDPAEVSRAAGHAEIAVDHTHTPGVSLNNCSILLGVFL